MLVLLKQAGGRRVTCYQRPRTLEGYRFLEEQRKRLQGDHTYYYVWDTKTKDSANAFVLAKELQIDVTEFYKSSEEN